MIEKIVEKSRTIKTKSNNYNIKEKKMEILVRLQMAIEKLKESWKEIHTTVQLAMNLKENGDDIADNVMMVVGEAFTISTNFSELKNDIHKKN